MRRFLVITFSLVLFPALGSAQELQEPRGLGHVFFAPVKIYPGGGKALHFGGGGEGQIYKGLTAGADLGYLFAPEGGFGKGIGLLSVGGSYRFPLGEGLTPFASAGYGLAFRGETQNLFYFGGGITQWFTQRTGIRLEVRDYVAPNFCGCDTGHALQFRVGLTFR